MIEKSSCPGLLSRTVFALAVIILLTVKPAHAQVTITFDDLTTTTYAPIPNGYNGFDWRNFYVINPSFTLGSNGYKNGVYTTPNDAFNGGGAQASITSSTPFTLDSAYFTAAWSNGLNISIEGYNGATLVDSITLVTDTTGPTFTTFNWNGITEVVFDSSGGTDAGYGGKGDNFAMDNLVVTSTPEPPTLFLFVGAILLLGMKVLRAR